MVRKVLTANSKYIFIDIVSYSDNRSVEAQTEIIAVLNKIVKDTILNLSIEKAKVLYIPTGDGMCITLLEIANPYDIHLKVATTILNKLNSYNRSIKDKMRQFQLRIGINENIDNLITDINNNKNIAGSGINIASRILNLCDPSQILVSSTVYDRLVQREKYMNSFIEFAAEIKHNNLIQVYQYTNYKLTFLNNNIPIFLKRKKSKMKSFHQ